MSWRAIIADLQLDPDLGADRTVAAWHSNGRLATKLWLLAITLGLDLIGSFVVALLALDGATYLVHRLFAVYRLLGALNSVLVWLWVTPDMHKVHHSREQVETDSNYANLFSFFDRVFRTFTPSTRGRFVRYGIRGYAAREHQSIRAVLWLPFQRSVNRAGADYDRHSEA